MFKSIYNYFVKDIYWLSEKWKHPFFLVISNILFFIPIFFNFNISTLLLLFMGITSSLYHLFHCNIFNEGAHNHFHKFYWFDVISCLIIGLLITIINYENIQKWHMIFFITAFIFYIMQNKANYVYVHSLWHIFISIYSFLVVM